MKRKKIIQHAKSPWSVEQVPIESRGGSNTCFKIGPFVACIYDDWRQRDRGFSEDEIKANANLIALSPDILHVLITSEQTVRNIGQEFPWESDKYSICEQTSKGMRDVIRKATGRDDYYSWETEYP